MIRNKRCRLKCGKINRPSEKGDKNAFDIFFLFMGISLSPYQITTKKKNKKKL